MPDSAPSAVFVSYAREDTDAARRIADALPSQGVEVWFDQSELPAFALALRRDKRGGDAWDARLRREGRVRGSSGKSSNPQSAIPNPQ
ncbi:MAG: toll/interleukin-1 receptor domain-containing protein [Verrucomicrobia bacterium]|nr:toll/interleukin-1 receptor domain-containing protein [Verrucomicrobiota bacterium]